MATTIDLYPPILAALEVKIGAQTFSCLGKGLIKSGHVFSSDVQSSLPLLEPKRTQAGKIAVRQPYIAKQPADWWRAQCAFRGLSPSGAVADMQERLRHSPHAPMTPKLQALQQRLNTEYLESNAVAWDAKWLALDSNEARAEMHATRFLREEFVEAPDAAMDKVIVLKTEARSAVHQAAELLGLEHQSVDAPLSVDGSRQRSTRWLVVGKSSSAVFAEISKISRDTQRSRQRADEAQDDQVRKLHQKVVSRLTASDKSATWNVVGSWSIRSRCIENNYGNGIDKCTLDIYRSRGGGRHQIFAIFDFLFVRGIMRFINPHSSQHSPGTGGRPVRPRGKADEGEEVDDEGEDEEEEEDEDDEGDDEEEEDDEEEGDEEEEEECSEGFYIEDKFMPSRSNPTWRYRWRGEETGEGEIQLGSDEVICSLTFKGEGGTELEGVLKPSICCSAGCHFSGVKISHTPSSSIPDPEHEWNSRNEKAYEYARKARWGGKARWGW